MWRFQSLQRTVVSRFESPSRLPCKEQITLLMVSEHLLDIILKSQSFLIGLASSAAPTFLLRIVAVPHRLSGCGSSTVSGEPGSPLPSCPPNCQDRPGGVAAGTQHCGSDGARIQTLFYLESSTQEDKEIKRCEQSWQLAAPTQIKNILKMSKCTLQL